MPFIALPLPYPNLDDRSASCKPLPFPERLEQQRFRRTQQLNVAPLRTLTSVNSVLAERACPLLNVQELRGWLCKVEQVVQPLHCFPFSCYYLDPYSAAGCSRPCPLSFYAPSNKSISTWILYGGHRDIDKYIYI